MNQAIERIGLKIQLCKRLVLAIEQNADFIRNKTKQIPSYFCFE